LSFPALTTISQAHYERLLAHASTEPDFTFIGSIGDGPGRGSCSGFSCRAIEIKTLALPDVSTANIAKITSYMEVQVNHYQVEPDHSEQRYLTGGWLGLMSYELGYIKEHRLATLCPVTSFPLLHAGFYLWAASRDHRTNTFYLWIHPECPDAILEILARWQTDDERKTDNSWHMPCRFVADQLPDAYRNKVSLIREYIAAGDCYQANVSQMFTGRYSGSSWQAFKALSRANPTPYSAFIRIGDASVLSISPERFLEINGNTVITSPIKGTRPRGKTPVEDAAYATELQASEKDRAENLMIVDLLRNDLSVNAATGSVIVDNLFTLESYQNVHHLVSHIRAKLAEGVTPMKALLDAFPGGSITGAPKIRAMEIIRELESHWRGPYCGSVFYRSLNGKLNSSIAIRTLLCDSDNTIRCWGGGGIVPDSDPESEYQETLTKVQSLMAFLEGYHGED
jgi:para-aminobenzoate synthetase component 1